jgi:hypothetical protein
MDVIPRLDKLERLGAKLDAADKSGGDEWAGLFDMYAALALKRALATRPPPKVQIKSVAGFWQVNAMLGHAYDRVKAIEAEISDNETKGSLRANCDLKAALAVAHRDWQVIAAAVRAHNDRKKAKREAWREARRLVRIPERDRIPQR